MILAGLVAINTLYEKKFGSKPALGNSSMVVRHVLHGLRILGTMTVILLLAFGVSVHKQMSKNMHGIGEGIAIVWPGRTSIPFEGYGRDRRIRLNEDDIELIDSLVLNESKLIDTTIFRLKEHSIALFIHCKVVQDFKSNGCKGAKFIDVSDYTF